MYKKQFKDSINSMADALYDKGFKDGVNSCKEMALINVEEADGSFSWAIRLGKAEFSRTIEIPQALLNKINGVA